MTSFGFILSQYLASWVLLRQMLLSDQLFEGHKVKPRAVHHRMLLLFTMLAIKHFKLHLVMPVLVLQHSVGLVAVAVALDQLLKGLNI